MWPRRAWAPELANARKLVSAGANRCSIPDAQVLPSRLPQSLMREYQSSIRETSKAGRDAEQRLAAEEDGGNDTVLIVRCVLSFVFE